MSMSSPNKGRRVHLNRHGIDCKKFHLSQQSRYDICNDPFHRINRMAHAFGLGLSLWQVEGQGYGLFLASDQMRVP